MKKVMFSLMLLAGLCVGANAQTTAKTKTTTPQTTQKTKSEGSESKEKVKAATPAPQKMHTAMRPKHKKHISKSKHKTSTPK
jgi:recombinational DNA repair protein (RecF pathway)